METNFQIRTQIKDWVNRGIKHDFPFINICKVVAMDTDQRENRSHRVHRNADTEGGDEILIEMIERLSDQGDPLRIGETIGTGVRIGSKNTEIIDMNIGTATGVTLEIIGGRQTTTDTQNVEGIPAGTDVIMKKGADRYPAGFGIAMAGLTT